MVRQGVGDVARGERQLARTLGRDRLVDLEDQLAFEQVERLVEVVEVQRRPRMLLGDHDLDHGQLSAGLLTAKHDVRLGVFHGSSQ